MKNSDNKLRPEQLAAIKKGITLGKTLQKDHPEIADLYRQNHVLSKITEVLNIQEEYGVGYHVAWSGVQNALSGQDGSFGINSYNGLLEESERIMIGKKNFQENARNNALRLYTEGKGIFGRTPEQMTQDSRKGGKIAGRKTYEEKKGIFGRTPKQHSKDSKIAGQKSAIARGFTLWTEDERSLAYQLSQQPEYKWGKGRNEGKTNMKKISQELLKRGYSHRTIKAVRKIICRKKKSLENIV